MTSAPAGRAGRLFPAAPRGLAAAGLPRLTERLPEPGHLWIRFAPKAWEGPELPWLDLAAGRLGRSGPRGAASLPAANAGGQAGLMDLGAGGDGGAAAGPPLDDVLVLPPVPDHLAGWRDALAEHVLAAGTPVLVQLLPHDETRLTRPPASEEPGAVIVVDLLAALLATGPAPAEELPSQVALTVGASAVAVFPLLPGITDDPELWERCCQALAAAGIGCLQAVVPAFGPGDRRRLAQGQPAGAFAALFHRQHRQPAAERDLARVAHRHGLAPFLPRPLPRSPLGRRENRRIAGQLALAAELWLRLGRPVEQAQALFRAARWLDATGYDAGSLCREGNLGVVTALDPVARRAVAEAAADGEPALLGELMAEYLGP